MAGPFVSNALDFPNLTVKATPIGADSILIKDSVTGNAEQALISTLPSSGASAKSVFAMGYGNANNDFYYPLSGGPTANTVSLVANTLYCLPIIIPISTLFTKIGVEVTTGSGSTSMRLGIYDNGGTGGYPGARIVDAGTVSTVTGGLVVTATISQTLLGAYWLVGICNSASPIFRAMGGLATLNGQINLSHLLGFVGTAVGTDAVVGLSEASVASYFTALPASLSADTFSVVANGVTPAVSAIFLKV